MATVSSNMDEIEALLDTVVDSFNLTSPGTEGKGLGNEMLDIAAEGVHERTIARQSDPDGNDLANNADEYKKRRDKQGKPIGVLEGEMLSMVELKGTRTIEPDEATMEYGQSTFAKRKAQWFTRGSAENPPSDIEHSGADNQPARKFYAADDEIKRRMTERADQALTEHIQGI